MIIDRPSEEEILLRKAVDKALARHVAMLVGNWMVDDDDQPQRAFHGIRKAIDVWHEAVKAIETGEI
jgi:hypothetical protein